MVHSNDHDRVTSSITSTNEVLYDLSYEASQTPSLLANKPFTICTPNTSGLGNSFNPFEPQIEDIFFHSNPFPLVYDGSEFIDFAAPTQLLALPQSPYRFDTAGSNLGHPPKRTKLVPIAPHPVGLQKLHALKRSRSEVSDSHDPAELQLSKRRKRSPSLTPPSNFNLSKEDNLLIQLREYENLPWKDIALRFEVEVGKVYKVATLQMRYHRLRLRIKMWTDTDINALQQAHSYWDKSKWDIISTKMLSYDPPSQWSPHLCARKWEALHLCAPAGLGIYTDQIDAQHDANFNRTEQTS